VLKFVELNVAHRRRRREGRGARASSQNIFFGQLSCKIPAFFGNFVNFSVKHHVKFVHFVNFSYIYFGQKPIATRKLTELLRPWRHSVILWQFQLVEAVARRRELPGSRTVRGSPVSERSMDRRSEPPRLSACCRVGDDVVWFSSEAPAQAEIIHKQTNKQATRRRGSGANWWITEY